MKPSRAEWLALVYRWQSTKVQEGQGHTDTHLNSIEPSSIKFTKEEKGNNQIVVLGVELNAKSKNKENSLQCTLNWKSSKVSEIE